MSNNKWYIPMLKQDVFSLFGLKIQEDFVKVSKEFREFAKRYHPDTSKNLPEEPEVVVRTKRELLKPLAFYMKHLKWDRMYRDCYYNEGFIKAELLRATNEVKELQQYEMKEQQEETQELQEKAQKQRKETQEEQTEKQWKRHVPHISEESEGEQSYQGNRRKFSYIGCNERIYSENTGGGSGNPNQQYYPSFTEDGWGRSGSSSGRNNAPSQYGGNGTGLYENECNFGPNPSSFGSQDQDQQLSGNHHSHPRFGTGFNPFCRPSQPTFLQQFADELRNVEELKESLRRKEQELKIEESRHEMRYTKLEEEEAEVTKQKASLMDQKESFEAECLQEREDMQRQRENFQAEADKFRLDREQYEDETKQWRISKDKKERDHSLKDAELTERELEVSKREAELAYDDATRSDHDLLISQRAAAQRELDDLQSKLTALKRDVQDSVLQASHTHVGTSKLTASKNRATTSAKAAKRLGHTRWDAIKDVRVCLLCPDDGSSPFEHNDKRKVRQHVANVHKIGKTYGCPHCGRILCRAEKLKQHVAKIHDLSKTVVKFGSNFLQS